MMSKEGPGRGLFKDTLQTHKFLVKIADNSTQNQTGYVLKLKTDFIWKTPPSVESLRLSGCVMSSPPSPLGVMALS
jgi:hypothetical protein